MCFSAEASFAGAAVAGAIGVATLTQLRRPRDLVYGSLPLAFGVHQLVEGLTWQQLEACGLPTTSGWTVRLWVVFAWALVPLWVPLGVWLLEPDPRRRRWMGPLVGLGLVMLVVLGGGALRPELSVRSVHGYLDYALPFEYPVPLATAYVLVTCLTPILSSYARIRWFGIANLVAIAVTLVIEHQGFASIWCFFAAWLSLLVYLHFRDVRRHGPMPAPDPVVLLPELR